MTKDNDFCDLLYRLGPPPKIIWPTCGNTSNQGLKNILFKFLPQALDIISGQEVLVEIKG